MDGIVSPINSYVEALIPNGTILVFRDRDFKEVIRVQWDHRMEP